MSIPPDQIPQLPRVASPPGWLWHYFRMRYLPAVASGAAVVTAVWLWAINLPESTGGARTSNLQQADVVSKPELQAGTLLITNVVDLQVTPTNGSLSLGGGL